MAGERLSTPSPARLEWCARVLGAGPEQAHRIAVQPLRGGLDAATHALTLPLDGGRVREVVLRELVRRGETSEAPYEIHAAVLSSLPALSWPELPRCLAVDPQPTHAEHPALLMTRVGGRPNLAVDHADRRVRELGRALAALHAARPAAPRGCPRFRVTQLPAPRRTNVDVCDWNRVVGRLEGVRWGDPLLIHADFHIGNALFDGEQLTGIVDWASARVGPAGFDVGYCQMDLAVLFGPDVANAFVEAYEAARGGRVARLSTWALLAALVAYPDPSKWLTSWHALGRSDLTTEVVRGRFAAFVNEALGGTR